MTGIDIDDNTDWVLVHEPFTEVLTVRTTEGDNILNRSSSNSSKKSNATLSTLSSTESLDLENSNDDTEGINEPRTPTKTSTERKENTFCPSSRSLSGLDPSNTVIIFDWDDTIMPSTWIRENRPALSYLSRPPGEERFMVPLARIQDALYGLLQVACSLGQVMIITNAKQPWVRTSSKNYLPYVLPLLQDIPVTYAQELWDTWYEACCSQCCDSIIPAHFYNDYNDMVAARQRSIVNDDDDNNNRKVSKEYANNNTAVTHSSFTQATNTAAFITTTSIGPSPWSTHRASVRAGTSSSSHGHATTTTTIFRTMLNNNNNVTGGFTNNNAQAAPQHQLSAVSSIDENKITPSRTSTLVESVVETGSALRLPVTPAYRGRYDPSKEPPSYLWKKLAFAENIKQFYAKKRDAAAASYGGEASVPWSNVISIGDADFERIATRYAVDMCSPPGADLHVDGAARRIPRAKTIKMFEHPTIEQLTEQVNKLTVALPQIVSSNLNIDVDVEDLLVP